MKRRYRSILLRVALLSFVLYSAVKIIGLQIEIYQKRETVREIEQQIEQQQLRNAALQDMLDEGMSEEMVKKIALPCTACRYCTSHCPQNLDIPMLLDLYNEHAFTGGGFIAPMALMAVPEEKQPGACIGCGSCEQVCPQQIKISKAMADFSAMLG